MSRSPITTTDVGAPEDWLHNPHAGEMLALEFLEPAGMNASQLATALQVPVSRILAVLSGAERMEADLDLRLARFFGMSPGFFLGLQIDYELLEAQRSLTSELERIIPRAA